MNRLSRLSDAETFVAVVEAGSFSAAAQALERSQPAISRRVTGLEARLGVRLLVRSTRRLRLTEAGAAYYERCRRLLAELAEAEADAGATAQLPRGVLRVTAPPLLARRRLVPRLSELLARWPELQVELTLAERVADVVEEDFDCAVRLFDPGRRPGVIARRVGSIAIVTCAAPAYLSARGTPRRPADLATHDCLLQLTRPLRDRWTYGAESVTVQGRLRTTDVEALRVAALAGLGIARLPALAVDDDLRAGQLRLLLTRWRPAAVPVFAVYRERRHLPARVRVFVEFLAAVLRG
jgi:DNA-binding transcriptional LysR family regulator